MVDVNYLVVASLDFGTTFSGYAFAFTSNPDDIRLNKNWGENLGFQVRKCTILSGFVGF